MRGGLRSRANVPGGHRRADAFRRSPRNRRVHGSGTSNRDDPHHRQRCVQPRCNSLRIAFGQAAFSEINQARKAQAAEAVRARRSEYAADMPNAQRLIADNNRGPALKLLKKYEDTKDLRGWEWFYLSELIRGPELAVLRGHTTRVVDLA